MFTILSPLEVPGRPQWRVSGALAALALGRIAEIKLGLIEGSEYYNLAQISLLLFLLYFASFTPSFIHIYFNRSTGNYKYYNAQSGVRATVLSTLLFNFLQTPCKVGSILIPICRWRKWSRCLFSFTFSQIKSCCFVRPRIRAFVPRRKNRATQ